MLKKNLTLCLDETLNEKQYFLRRCTSSYDSHVFPGIFLVLFLQTSCLWGVSDMARCYVQAYTSGKPRQTFLCVVRFKVFVLGSMDWQMGYFSGCWHLSLRSSKVYLCPNRINTPVGLRYDGKYEEII